MKTDEPLTTWTDEATAITVLARISGHPPSAVTRYLTALSDLVFEQTHPAREAAAWASGLLRCFAAEHAPKADPTPEGTRCSRTYELPLMTPAEARAAGAPVATPIHRIDRTGD